MVYETTDFLKIYRESTSDKDLCALLQTKYGLNLKISDDDLKVFIEIEDKIKKDFFLQGKYHLSEIEYPFLLNACRKIQSISKPGDMLIFLGRTPCWLYVILKILNIIENRDLHLLPISYSGGNNSRQNLIPVIKNEAEFAKAYETFLCTEITYLCIEDNKKPAIELMDEKFYLSYKFISKIICPEALTHYLTILKKIISQDYVHQSERIVIIDRTVTGNTLKGFIDLLGIAFGCETINKKVCYINMDDEANPETKFSFKRFAYENDYITYLGGLSLARPLARLLDEAPLEECLFYYYPPVLWGKNLSNFLPAYENDRSKTILSNLISFVSRETKTAFDKNYLFDCIMHEVHNFNRQYCGQSV